MFFFENPILVRRDTVAVKHIVVFGIYDAIKSVIWTLLLFTGTIY